MASIIASHGRDIAQAAIAYARANPAVAGLATAGVAFVAAPGAALAPLYLALPYAGFGASGIGGGTAAASIQAGIGNVIAPSLFATLTSAGAGGYGVAVLNGVVQWVGGTLIGVAGATGASQIARD